MKSQLAYELIVALILVVAITLGYAFLAHNSIPHPRSPLGYTLGIVGFLMMLSTEILYSMRKRMHGFNYGPMSIWLQLHIVTGIVGPYLVLLHSAWKFNGLAGLLTLLTFVVVLSGLIGRYIYTAVPRSLDGAELSVAELEVRIGRTTRQLNKLGVEHLGADLAGMTALPSSGWKVVLGRPILMWRQKRQWGRLLSKMDRDNRPRAKELHKLLTERQRLRLQIQSLEAARRLLALWHVFHIPISGGLFILAFVHIAGAMYYASFMK